MKSCCCQWGQLQLIGNSKSMFSFPQKSKRKWIVWPIIDVQLEKNSSLGNSRLSTAKMKDCSWQDRREGDTEISAIMGSEKKQHSLNHHSEKAKKWTYFFDSQPDLFSPFQFQNQFWIRSNFTTSLWLLILIWTFQIVIAYLQKKSRCSFSTGAEMETITALHCLGGILSERDQG